MRMLPPLSSEQETERVNRLIGGNNWSDYMTNCVAKDYGSDCEILVSKLPM